MGIAVGACSHARDASHFAKEKELAMQLGVLSFLRSSFRWKLALYGMAVVLLVVIVYYFFLDYELNTITTFSLAENTAGTKQMVEEYLTRYADEKALSTWDQIMDAQANLVVLGETAQKIIDEYDALRDQPDLFELALFRTQLDKVEGALSSGASTQYDAFAPPAIADNPRSRELLTVSGLMNLNMDSLFESDKNNSFVYFVGGPNAPVTRAYPNIDLRSVLGESVNALFWKDFFANNPKSWSRWYRDQELQARVPSPVTMEAPYEDAAQQGLTVTMFYPLWDKSANQFAGAVGLDITLSNIVNNILAVTIGKSGFAFLVNGQGDVIAMPKVGYELFGLERSTMQRGSLVYSVVPLTSSTNPAVDNMTFALLNAEKGIYHFTLDQSEGSNNEQREDGYLVAFSGLPPFYNSQYNEDRWKIATVVPESEIFAVLRQTDAAISQERHRISQRSLGLALGFSLVAFVLAVQLSKTVTRDLQTLSAAAAKVSAKQYDVNIQINSTDEVGRLGVAFASMTREIRDYTMNLEEKIARRTKDLQQANAQISKLNEQLKDENLRLSAELNVARHLQMMVLPSSNEMKMVEELDIAGYSRPADEVGGDYYDILRSGDEIYFGIGDVTGHGLPAGVIMLMAQTALLTLVQSGEQDLSRMMTMLNNVLYRNIIRIRDDKSMTMAVFRYNNRTFEVAGQHESVLILRANSAAGQAVEEIDTISIGFPLGLDDDITKLVSTERFQLVSGDVMVLYTDGITEAENPQGHLYGLGRLKALLSQCRHLDAQGILDRIVADVYEFIGETHVYDDISALVVKQK
jgi:sigma-B regulation protein RsbU (phosphoserine phosphatase)